LSLENLTHLHQQLHHLQRASHQQEVTLK
jgi:hypothetical protein